MALVITAFIMVSVLCVIAVMKLEAERQSEQFSSISRYKGTFAD